MTRIPPPPGQPNSRKPVRKPVKTKKSAATSTTPATPATSTTPATPATSTTPETTLPSAANVSSNKNNAQNGTASTSANPAPKPRKSIRPSGQSGTTTQRPPTPNPQAASQSTAQASSTTSAQPASQGSANQAQTANSQPQDESAQASTKGGSKPRQSVKQPGARPMRPPAPPVARPNTNAGQSAGAQKQQSPNSTGESVPTATSQIQQIAVKQAIKGGKRKGYKVVSERRQARVFTVVITGLAVCLIAGIVCSLIPWQYTGFKVLPTYAEAGDTPCPVAGTKMVSPEGVQVTVLNATSTAGLAGSVGETLESLGYTLAGVDNSPSTYHGAIQIEAGPNGVDDAYTLAMYLTGTQTEEASVNIILNETQTNALTVILGDAFEEPTEEDIAAAQAYTDDLVAFNDSCKEMDTTTITE